MRAGWLRWALVALLVGALYLHTGRALGRLSASRTLRQVEAVSRLAIERGEAPRGLFDLNLDLLTKAAARDPTDVAIAMNRGSQYLLSGRFEAAIAAYRGALGLEPRPEIYLNLGRALALAGRTTEATTAIDTAIALNPKLIAEGNRILGR